MIELKLRDELNFDMTNGFDFENWGIFDFSSFEAGVIILRAICLGNMLGSIDFLIFIFCHMRSVEF